MQFLTSILIYQNTRVDNPKRLNIILTQEEVNRAAQTQKERPSNSDQDKQASLKTIEETVRKTEDREIEQIDIKETPSTVKNPSKIITSLSISPNSIKTFTDNYNGSKDTVPYSNSLEAFDESFTPEPVGDRRPYNSVIERNNGVVDARVRVLGLRICYTFYADSEFIFPNYYKCPSERKIKLNIKRKR